MIEKFLYVPVKCTVRRRLLHCLTVTLCKRPVRMGDIIDHQGLRKLTSCKPYISGGPVSRPYTAGDISRILGLFILFGSHQVSQTILRSVYRPMAYCFWMLRGRVRRDCDSHLGTSMILEKMIYSLDPVTINGRIKTRIAGQMTDTASIPPKVRLRMMLSPGQADKASDALQSSSFVQTVRLRCSTHDHATWKCHPPMTVLRCYPPASHTPLRTLLSTPHNWWRVWKGELLLGLR